MFSFDTKLILSLVLLCGAAFAQDCPCTLDPADNYVPGYKWNCMSKGLLSVPGECWNIQALNVTEVVLTNNFIDEVKGIDFSGLTDVKYLGLNYNSIVFVDPTSLDYMVDLEKLHLEYNSGVEIPSITLRNKPSLIQAIFTSSAIGIVPSLTSTDYLERLDIRSCSLTSLPKTIFSSTLVTNGSDFLLTAVGNNIVDVSCSTLLPMPALATVNLDSYVTFWCADAAEKAEILAKNWNININMGTNVKVCSVDGSPTVDTSVC